MWFGALSIRLDNLDNQDGSLSGVVPVVLDQEFTRENNPGVPNDRGVGCRLPRRRQPVARLLLAPYLILVLPGLSSPCRILVLSGVPSFAAFVKCASPQPKPESDLTDQT